LASLAALALFQLQAASEMKPVISPANAELTTTPRV
jgi:hypothetical protein